MVLTNVLQNLKAAATGQVQIEHDEIGERNTLERWLSMQERTSCISIAHDDQVDSAIELLNRHFEQVGRGGIILDVQQYRDVDRLVHRDISLKSWVSAAKNFTKRGLTKQRNRFAVSRPR
jgi:hypothetical protein